MKKDQRIEILVDENAELREENKKLREENKNLKEERDLYKARNEELNEDCFGLANENKKLKEYNGELIENRKKDIAILCEENKKLKEENQYRESIADVLPEGEGHIAEETIQDLQDRIKELIGKIDQLEEENENLRKDLFHLTNNGQRKNPAATSRAEGVKGEGGEEQEKNARDS